MVHVCDVVVAFKSLRRTDDPLFRNNTNNASNLVNSSGVLNQEVVEKNRGGAMSGQEEEAPNG